MVTKYFFYNCFLLKFPRGFLTRNFLEWEYEFLWVGDFCLNFNILFLKLSHIHWYFVCFCLYYRRICQCMCDFSRNLKMSSILTSNFHQNSPFHHSNFFYGSPHFYRIYSKRVENFTCRFSNVYSKKTFINFVKIKKMLLF